jgi:chromosome segregation ATPase
MSWLLSIIIYIIKKKELKAEINLISEDNQELKVQIHLKSQDIDSLNSELTQLNQKMGQLAQDKQRMIAERNKVIAELKHIETEIELASIKVKDTNSLYGKFSIIWTLIQSLFFSEDPQDFGKIDNSLPDYNDKPQMGTTPSDIGKNLLDK